LNGVTKFRESPAHPVEMVNQIEDHTHSLIVDAMILLEIADESSSRNVDIREAYLGERIAAAFVDRTSKT
jgi:hypothetical protein